MATQAYLLVPGLIVPETARDFVPAQALECVKPLSENLAGDALKQEIGEGVFSRSAHLSWLWSVLMRQNAPAQCAAYAWPVKQGPQLFSNDVFELHFAHADDAGVLHAVTLTDAQIEAVSLAATPVLAQSGFTLQRWDADFFLTRKTPWEVVARPFEAMAGFVRDFSRDLEPNPIVGAEPDACVRARAFVEDLESTVSALGLADAGGRAVNAAWICAGGRYANVYPPTKIRSVLADDATVIGWALAAGILNHRMGPAAGVTEWPSDAPNGECIAVVDTLYEAWLSRDWTRWAQKLPETVEQIRALSLAARRKGCDQALVVGFGNAVSVSIPQKLTNPRSLLARFSGVRSLAPSYWLFAGEDL